MQFRHVLIHMAEDKDRPSNKLKTDETTVLVELEEKESVYHETHVYSKTVEMDMSVVECLGHARIDWERVRRCTREEKEQAARLIDRLVKMEEQIRIEGDAVAYKDFINTLDDPFQETAMLLLFWCIGEVFLAIATLFAVLSGLIYLKQNWDIVKNAK